jgi:hypothetical protein
MALDITEFILMLLDRNRLRSKATAFCCLFSLKSGGDMSEGEAMLEKINSSILMLSGLSSPWCIEFRS